MLSNIFSKSLIWALLLVVYCAPVSNADNIKNSPPQSTDDTKTAPTSGIIDDSAPGWIFNGFSSYDDSNLKNGTGHAGGPGTYAAFTFTGTNLDVVGLSAPAVKIDGHPKRLGRAKISIDGKVVSETNLQSRDINYDYNITTITGLQNGNHVLQIEPVNGWIVIDYIKVTGPSSDTTKADDKKNITNKKTLDNGLYISEGDYYLTPKNALDKYLEPVNGGVVNNTKLEIYSWDPNRVQGWHVTRFDTGFYKITPLSNPDVAITFVPKEKDQVNAKKQLTILWEFGGYPSQILAIVPKPDKYFEIVMAGDTSTNPMCLDVLNKMSINETPVINYDYWNGNNQLWRFVPLEAVAQ